MTALVFTVLAVALVAGLLLYALTHHRQEKPMATTTERGTIPQTWPELQLPTPAQWVEWFLANPPAGQLVIAERMLADAETASLCRVRNHDGMQAQLDALAVGQRDAAVEYQRGWSDGLAELQRRVEAEFDAKYPREPQA